MVKALHRAGIEVILDVVFNHTTEGGHSGPTLCYRGLANEFYYILQQDKSHYADFTGCGNTLNANQPIVRRMIQDSLRYWVTQMHVDGFRFDLASILSRDETGQPLQNPPVLWDIESDPLLAGTKLIAEAWDAAGLYQVGSFVGDTWQEWNGRFRDDVRRFWKGDKGTVSALATRLLGSPDLYAHEEREAEQSINFVTCHDGFTLNDLVSYNQKHNEANGEDNRDGCNNNLSWNCGVEGPTDDPDVEALRSRQVKNFLTVLMLAVGTPMLLMGDEMRRSQGGNNNAYCLDDEAAGSTGGCWSGTPACTASSAACGPPPAAARSWTKASALTLNQLLQWARIEWHGVALGQPDWSDHSHSLAFTAHTPHWQFALHAMFNAYWEPLAFELPRGGRRTAPMAALGRHRAAVTRRFLRAGRGAAGDRRHLSRAGAVVCRAVSALAAGLGREGGVSHGRASLGGRARTGRSARRCRRAGGSLLRRASRRAESGRARQLRHERPPRVVARAHVQRGARAGDHAGDLRLPERARHRRSAVPGEGHARAVRAAFMTALEVLAANGVDTMIDHREGYTPTPAISHAILAHNRGRTSRLADGIVITPSHNPPEDGGFKYNPPTGGPADTTITRWIENRANELLAAGAGSVPRIPYARAQTGPDHACARLRRRLRRRSRLGGRHGRHSRRRAAHRRRSARRRQPRVLARDRGAVRRSTSRSSTTRWTPRSASCRSTGTAGSAWTARRRYAMARLIALKDRFDVAFGNDPDSDRHGIVTRAGLMNPNHYLAAAISYLFTHRAGWRGDAAVGKTVVSSSIIDRVAARAGRALVEVPVGFKWFVAGLLDGSLGFGGEESAGASFLRRDGTVWTTDKDGIIMDLLAVELTARTGRDPAELYADLTRELGTPVYERVDAPATPEEKAALLALGPERRPRDGAGRRSDRGAADQRARQRRADRRPEGHHAPRLVRGAPIRHRSGLQALRRKLPRPRTSPATSRRKRARSSPRRWQEPCDDDQVRCDRTSAPPRTALVAANAEERQYSCGGPFSSDTARRSGP